MQHKSMHSNVVVFIRTLKERTSSMLLTVWSLSCIRCQFGSRTWIWTAEI